MRFGVWAIVEVGAPPFFLRLAHLSRCVCDSFCARAKSSLLQTLSIPRLEGNLEHAVKFCWARDLERASTSIALMRHGILYVVSTVVARLCCHLAKLSL